MNGSGGWAIKLLLLQTMSDGTKKDWRELAALVSVETDPVKLIDMIAQLTKALEEYRRDSPLTPQKPK
jgi:5'-deoxynucleotidase YfbR-like HD superfamily hydrolase